jgi:hypothetical protein
MKPVRERGSIPGSVVIHRDVTCPLPPVECWHCEPAAPWPRADCAQCWETGLIDNPEWDPDGPSS